MMTIESSAGDFNETRAKKLPLHFIFLLLSCSLNTSSLMDTIVALRPKATMWSSTKLDEISYLVVGWDLNFYEK